MRRSSFAAELSTLALTSTLKYCGVVNAKELQSSLAKVDFDGQIKEENFEPHTRDIKR